LPSSLARFPDLALTDANEALAKAHIVVFLVNHKSFAAIDPDRLQGKAVVNACGWRQ